MFLVARVTNAQWFQCPLPIISHRLKPKLPSLLYNAKFYRFNKLSYSLDKESDDFLLWLERKAGTHVSSILSIGKSSYGRALYASKVIRTGDCILRVPYKVQLAPDNLPYEIKSLLTDEIGHVAKLAIVVLLEMKLEKHSDWVPYISYFPCLKDMHSTIFWSNDELEMIRQSSLYHETIHQKSLVKNEFLTIKNAIERYEIFESITYKDFMHAYALVSSRAWGSIRGVSLIPFADFLNHDGNVEAFLLNDDEKQLSEELNFVTNHPLCKVLDYNCLSSSFRATVLAISSHSEPAYYHHAAGIPVWDLAMADEIDALERNQTWTIDSLPPNKHVVGCKWVYKIKHSADGSVECYKARLVAKGYTQQEGIDYNDTFALVAKLVTVKLAFALAAIHGWFLYQLDVNNVFLHGDLHKEVFMTLPQWYCPKGELPANPVCKLQKSI
ncbi:uncharacterized protein LOC133798499 isoform X3 [Humulus lupulus]|uniref:uncharacterized protein LOC133798499 isoform X3 n=1 Tax=Humulus lupulus TaxID=3486 RepID=UPI002B403497|nr:uncharacterized protein LOC133798499 isoform X3 [Humulus lupulus]